MKKLGSILVALLLGCVLATQVQAADINFTPSTTISGAGVMLYFEGYGTTFKRDKSYYNVSFIENTSSATTVMVNDCAGPYVYLGMNAGPVAGNKIVLQVLYDDGTTTGCGKVEFSGKQFVQSLSCDSQPPTWNEAPSLSCGSPNKVAFNVSASDALSDIAGYKVSIGSCVDKNISVTNATKDHTGVIELPLASCGVTLTASSNLTATIKPYDSGGNVGAAQTVSGIKVMQSTLTMQSVNCGTVHGRSITLEPMILGGNAASYMVSVNGAAATSYPGGSTIDVTGLETETTYSFSVSAVDGCGNESNAVSTSCTTIFEPYGGADYPEELIETSFDIQYTGSCPTSIAGGTAFSQAGASGAYSHSIDEIDVIGSFTLPDEFEEAYSNGYFHQDATKKQYAIVSNPKVLNGTYTQKTDGKNRLVLALGGDPAGVQTNLFRFQRENVGAGTTTISFVLEDLVGNATCPQNNLNSFRGLTIVYYKNGSIVAEQHQNHPIGTSRTYSYNFATAQGDDVMVDVRARYMAPCTAMAVSDLNVYGCLPKFITTRNGASIFCENQEVTLLATGIPNGTLQWQTSTDNANWQPISQNGMSIQVTVPLGNSYYRFRESASSAWSDTYTLLGQVCCTYLASQDEIWKEDFGTVTGRTSNSFVKNHTFKVSGKIDDCYYAVVSNSSQANQELDWPGGKKDHTGMVTGEVNGGFLVINVNNTIAPPVLIYEQEINPVQGFCESTYYNLSMFASNIAPGGLPSSFKFQVVDVVTREVLGEGETGDIADFGMANWLNYGVSFKPQGNPIKIQIYNTGYAGGGNDVVIDDIAVSVCNASVELLSNGKKVAEEVACGDNIPLEVKLNGNSNTFFGVSTPYYLWVRQTDGGAFEKLPAASGIGKDTYQAPTESGKEFTYKVIVAKDEATVLRAFSGTTDACDIYTETNVMTVTCIPCTTPTISLQASESVVCASATDPVTLTATVVSGVPASYVWSVKKQGDAVFTPLATHTTSNTTDTYTISTLPNGGATYQVKVVTPDGCQGTAETTVSVVTTHKPTVTTPDEKITCAIQAVTLTASVPDWTGVVSQQWYNNGVAIPGEIGRTLTTTDGGNYTITLTYASGCTETSDPLQMDKDDTPPTVSISVIEGETELTCNVTELTLLATATGNVDYFWSVEGSSSILSRTDKHTTSAPGKYTVLVTADNGCTDTDNITITQNITKPTASLSANRTTINCQDLDATLSASATGGVTPYQYAWNGGAYGLETSSTVTAGGNYTLKVKGYNGCESDVVTLPITENKTTPTAVITSDVTPAVITCATGSITLTATPADGAAPYQYDWGEGYGDVSTHTVSADGSYTVNIKDANFCTGTSTAFVVQSDTLSSAVSLSSLVDKFTCSLSSIVITASVDAAFTSKVDYVEWYKDGNLQAGQTGLTYTATEAASYQAVVYYTNGCHRGSAAIELTTENNIPTVQITATGNVTELTCSLTSIELTATITGGVEAYTYAWQKVGQSTVLTSTSTYAAIEAGDYQVTVTDANGCTATNNITITQDITKPTASLSANRTTINCQDTDATLTASATGGVTPYQYAWNGGAYGNETTSTVTAGGNYTLKVKGYNGCESDVATLPITENKTTPTAVITSDVTPAVITCATGSITLTATPADGAEPYQYDWGDGYGDVSTHTVSATGSYTVNVKDANFCTGTSTAFVVQSDTLTSAVSLSSLVDKFTCSLSSIVITASVDAAFTSKVDYVEWYKDGNLQAGQSALTYTATEAASYQAVVYYTNGCHRGSAAISLTNDSSMPTVTLSATATTLTCNQSTTTITATATAQAGIVNYEWNTGLSGATATTLTLTQGVDVLNNPYRVIVTDANGCSASAEIVIDEDVDKPAISITSDASEFVCSTASIKLQAVPQDPTAVYTYQWTDGPATDVYTITASGTYQVVATGSNGCQSDPVDVTINDAVNKLTVSIQSNVPDNKLTCYVDNIALTATPADPVGDVSYEWVADVTFVASSSNLQTVVAAGRYTVKAKDENGCTASDFVDITDDYAEPTITITPSAAELTCAVTSLDLTASAAEDDGTFYYEWDPAVQVSTPVLSVTEPGDYTVRVIGANGCDATATHTVDADESVPTVTIQTENNQTLITCAVTSIALQAQATGGVVAQDYQYVWTDNNETEALRRVTAEGSYTVVVTDDNGCSGTATVTITENIAKPVSHFDRDMSTELTCKNPSITLTPIIDTENLAPFDYYWSDGSTSNSRVIDQPVENLSMYVVSQVNGCDSEPSTITITQAENNLEVSIEADNTTLTCNRESVIIAAQVQGAVMPIASYTWTGGASSSSITVTQAGPYWVEVTDDNGCTAKSNTLDITEWYTMPDASLEQVGLDSMLITPIGDEAMPWIYQLDNDTTFIDGLSFSSYAGQHELFITDQNGCKAVVPFVIELKLVEIKIPAFFTPNDDDLNDTWEIDNIEYYPNAIIQIYDRYHKLLVEYKGADPGWDGMYNGHPMPSDDYWYYIRDIHIGRPKSGHFRLHRGKVYK